MSTKDWMLRAWKIDDEIKALSEARRKAYDQCISTTTALREVVASGDKEPHAKLERWAVLNGLINEKIDELVATKQEILKAIWGVQDTTYRTLLTERYINFKTWEQIAVSLNYCYRHVVKELHPKALSAVKIS